ncbi:MmpS family transport accessory protein [[Mycobacterium] nativiensis]|uniref:MmpS family transport accessory protein n=1 Tax=[Mycobacterium] nativiensis TaxID=2855503 RepID=A0ABU5XRT3_9MYCO|nr:MmpS family transport accessory protein [Mycolicibacter sp. MYC340]MEB3030658.1 MmpS family transport accessory protein [Mycolicibacter sp. MYC340]
MYLVVLATLCGAGAVIAHLRLSDIPDPAVAQSPRPPAIGRLNEKTVEYRLDGEAGTTVSVSYLDADGTVQELSATLPWQTTLHTRRLTVATGLMAQAETDPLSCRIAVDGHVRDEASSKSSAVACKVVVS